jgi:hypothetical protein
MGQRWSERSSTIRICGQPGKMNLPGCASGSDGAGEAGGGPPVLALVAQQRGLFSRLPIAPDAVAAVRRTHGIYMPDDGRINIAGLNQANLDHVVEGVLPHLIAGRDASNCNSRRSQEIPA